MLLVSCNMPVLNLKFLRLSVNHRHWTDGRTGGVRHFIAPIQVTTHQPQPVYRVGVGAKVTANMLDKN